MKNEEVSKTLVHQMHEEIEAMIANDNMGIGEYEAKPQEWKLVCKRRKTNENKSVKRGHYDQNIGRKLKNKSKNNNHKIYSD